MFLLMTVSTMNNNAQVYNNYNFNRFLKVFSFLEKKFEYKL